MKFTLIVCTYQRPRPLIQLLDSVVEQSLYPNQILIIDGSKDEDTQKILRDSSFSNLEYFKVKESERGLTKQRNFGIKKVNSYSNFVCFLDDDIILESEYFEKLIDTYVVYPDAIGVGGYISNEVHWNKNDAAPYFDEFKMDGYIRNLGSRNLLRKKLGFLSDRPPGIMPEFSNGLSIGFLPPSGETYPVEYFMGGVASYRKNIFDKFGFSEYFQGYGLYEDMDFCLRASRLGQLYVNTAARVKHHHEQSGRPDKFKYGKMVIRNGWYVWRVKYPTPYLKARLKWHGTAFLLTLVRLGNVITTQNRKEAFDESLGRIAGWWSLLLNKPKHEV
ncbi:GT2 family glycosyltransferase [Salegentibacter sp. 24]|uniref:glycosyltransferase family 2 protein n=1 Tax=Salegentibacter sp. 24 TaxID=2183986 RepID=UPI00105D0CF7|nr:glycosyltransferase family 2 protein [Salegentibacter sp. 24]TDN89168.1 GT2 family glycosyltransferase [Salegentibacter sp. 24]